MQSDISWFPVAITGATGVLGVAIGALLQPWISSRLDRSRYAWEQRQRLLARLRELEDEAAFPETVDFTKWHNKYVDFASETGIWCGDPLLSECHDWVVELVRNPDVDRDTLQHVLLATSVLLASNLSVEAGVRSRFGIYRTRRRLNKDVKARKLADKYGW